MNEWMNGWMKHTSNDRKVYFEDVQLQMDAKLWGEEYNRHRPPKQVVVMMMMMMRMMMMMMMMIKIKIMIKIKKKKKKIIIIIIITIFIIIIIKKL